MSIVTVVKQAEEDRNNPRITVRNIRALVREEFKRLLREAWYEESYDKNLMDDPVLKKKSVYVPDDIKLAIRKWMKAMGLDGSIDPRSP